MDFSELTVRLLLIFLPGIVCHFVVKRLTVQQPRKTYEDFLSIFVYGMLSYLTYALLHSVFHIRFGGSTWIRIPWPNCTVLSDALTDAAESIDFVEVACATLIAAAIGCTIGWFSTKRSLHRLAIRLKLTNKFADPDVWSFTFGSDEVDWAYVRDLENSLIFAGQVTTYSDIEDIREIVMVRVIVYNEKSGKELYRMDRAYIARPRDQITIELPDTGGQ